MRKIVNTVFVMLAMASVTYGMILRYAPDTEAVSAAPEILNSQSVALPNADLSEEDEYALGLDFVSEPD